MRTLLHMNTGNLASTRITDADTDRTVGTVIEASTGDYIATDATGTPLIPPVYSSFDAAQRALVMEYMKHHPMDAMIGRRS